MLVHLRRSLISIVVFTVFFGFVYAFVGTGVAQLLFKHQADGSITANGSTLIGQNWSATKCPGHPLGSCVFQGRPDDLGPYAANPKDARRPAGTTRWWPTATSGESGGDQPRPAVQGPAGQHQGAGGLLAQARASNPTPDLVTTSGSGLDPDITPPGRPGPDPDGLQGHRHLPVDAAGAHRPGRPTAQQLGFLGSSYIDVLQLNEALAQLR